MQHMIIKDEIRVPGSLADTYLETFLLDINEKFSVQERPLVLVCPGGGYHFTSEREAEIIAMQFNAMGYHTAVLRYSCAPAQFPTALLELSKAVAYLRSHAAEWKIDPDHIAVLGFSAGGHLAASLGVFWNTEWFAQIRAELVASQTETERDAELVAYQAGLENSADLAAPQSETERDTELAASQAGADEPMSDADKSVSGAGKSMSGAGKSQAGAWLTAEQIRPNGLILAYPVITSGEYAHRESFTNLLGEERGRDEKWLTKMSLEKQDVKDVPPAFVWHTSYDQSVPLENSLYFVTELIKARKPVEYHIFPGDVHGIGLADWRTRSQERPEDTAAVQWIPLAHAWLEKWKEG